MTAGRQARCCICALQFPHREVAMCSLLAYILSGLSTVFQPPARHTEVLDIYRYTLVHQYAGAPVYYLARRYASVQVTSFILTSYCTTYYWPSWLSGEIH